MTVIMNPPFLQCLHLKIFDKALKYTNNVICLSPAKWLQKDTYNRKMGQYRKLWNGRVSKIRLYNKEEVQTYFGIGNQIMTLGLVSTIGCPLDLEAYGFDSEIELSLFKKIDLSNNTYFRHIEHSPILRKYKWEPFIKDKIYIPIYAWHSGKTMKETLLRDKPKNCFLFFDSEEEVENFKNSLDTKFMNWMNNNIILKNDGQMFGCLPIAKSYKEPIDDEYFYKAFDLNEEEIKLIETSVSNSTNLIEGNKI